MLATMVDKENFGILNYLKWLNFAFSRYASHILSWLFENLFFIHIAVRIFELCKSLKTTYTFSHKIT